MTDTPERELIEIQFDRLDQVVTALANGSHYADDPECHPLYPGTVAAIQFLRDTIEALLSRVDKLEERVRELEDEIVDLWHESEAGRKELHECLGMTAEEYARWANPDALNKSAS